VKLPDNSGDVADTVAVRVEKGARVDLVDGAALPPDHFGLRAVHRECSQSLSLQASGCSEPSYRAWHVIRPAWRARRNRSTMLKATNNRAAVAGSAFVAVVLVIVGL